MSKLNQIQDSVLRLGAGAYQKLMDSYIMKKYGFNNIHPLGSHSGTDKTTKGTPDSYVRLDNGRFILIAHGTVGNNTFAKVESDIINCLDGSKTGIQVEDIEQIICCHTSTNFSPGQMKSLCSHFENTTLIGLGEVSYDLYLRFPDLAYKHLNIEIDTHQIFDYCGFVEYTSNNAYSTTLDMPLLCREKELSNIYDQLLANSVTVIFGQSGIGKTRLALESAHRFASENDYTLKIIRNNGESIYEDLIATFPDDKDYIVLVDDGDQLTQVNHLLDLCFDKNRSHSIKIIFTVRDYAKEILLRRIRDFVKPSVYILKSLSNESIKKVLSDNLGIKNELLIKQILLIAKGNVRLAIMAGMCAVNGHYGDLRNAFDIFNTYYSGMVDSFDHDELIVASIIAFFDSFALNEKCLPLEIAMSFGIDEIKFKEICSALRSKEVISIFDTQAVKFENQNLRDYLLYYVFFKEKWIKPSEIICLSFPAYRNKVVFAFNTLVNLFNSKDNISYIEKEVKIAWSTIKTRADSIILSFVEAFHQIIPDETLLFIKAQIEMLPEYHNELLSFDFDSSRNYHKINSKLIRILIDFKYTDRFEDAIQLSLRLFERNTEHPMDIYFLFAEEWGFGHNSYRNNYQDEFILINHLLTYHEQTMSALSAFCLLFTASSNLKLDFSSTEATSADSVTYIRFSLASCDAIYNIRQLSMRALHCLYKSKDFYMYALKALLNHNYYTDNPEEKNIVVQDIYTFTDLFMPSLNIDIFDSCLLLDHIEQICKDCSITYPEVLPNCRLNPVYNMFAALKKDYYLEYLDVDAARIAREHDISVLVANTSDQDFSNLWRELNNLPCKLSSRNNWEISTGIEIVFSYLGRNSKTRFVNCCESYLSSNAPFSQYGSKIVQNLIGLLGFDNALTFIKDHSFSYKAHWTISLYDNIPDDNICIQTCKGILECLINSNGNINIVSLKTALRINNIFPGFIVDYLSALNKVGETKPYLVSMFLQQVNFQNDLTECEFIELFNGDIHALGNAYINALRGKSYYDSHGDFLVLIAQKDTGFVKRLVRAMQKERLYGEDVNCLNVLWEQENYLNLISAVVDCLQENEDPLCCSSLGESLLMHNSKKPTVCERQDSWLKQYIELNYSNIDRMKFLFDIICNCTKDQIHQAVLTFCKFNTSFEDFKLLHIIPTHLSWSGSEVPLIEKQISFFENLKNSLIGFDFIEHRAYLSEYIQSYQRRKEAVLLHEFLNND